MMLLLLPTCPSIHCHSIIIIMLGHLLGIFFVFFPVGVSGCLAEKC